MTKNRRCALSRVEGRLRNKLAIITFLARWSLRQRRTSGGFFYNKCFIVYFAKNNNEKQKGEGAPGAKLKALAIGTALPTSRGFLPPELLLLLVTKVESQHLKKLAR